MSATIEVLSTDRFAQGESPRWLGGERLVWVDMATGELVRGRLQHGVLVVSSRTRVGDRIGCVTPTGDGALVVAADRSLYLLDGAGSDGEDRHRAPIRLGDLPPGDPWFNDGIADPTGRLWVGTQNAARTPSSSLYSIDANGRVRSRLNEVTVSNGICFSPDGRTMYYIDTLPHRRIEAFDVGDDGALTRRRTIAVVEGGNPDGMAIDVDGCLWVAVWDAGEVRHYANSGRMLRRIRLPAIRPSAVALVDDLLVITTARAGLDRPSTTDGAILGVTVSSPGVPAARAAISPVSRLHVERDRS